MVLSLAERLLERILLQSELSQELGIKLGIVGVWFIIGMFVGYALRMILKIVIAFIGICLISLIILQYYGFITVHWDRMAEAFTSATQTAQTVDWMEIVKTSAIPDAASFIAGVYVGFKKLKL